MTWQRCATSFANKSLDCKSFVSRKQSNQVGLCLCHRYRSDISNTDYKDAFYGTEDTNLHNVDVMTDVSMAPTAFTRYTAVPSVTSKASK